MRGEKTDEGSDYVKIGQNCEYLVEAAGVVLPLTSNIRIL
jgi:hypothetical protein